MSGSSWLEPLLEGAVAENRIRKSDVLKVVKRRKKTGMLTNEVIEAVQKDTGKTLTRASVWQHLQTLHKDGIIERKREGRDTRWTPKAEVAEAAGATPAPRPRRGRTVPTPEAVTA